MGMGIDIYTVHWIEMGMGTDIQTLDGGVNRNRNASINITIAVVINTFFGKK